MNTDSPKPLVTQADIAAQLRRALAGRADVNSQESLNVRRMDELDADHKQAQTEDLKTDTRLKKHYAYWFIGILIAQLSVMNVIFILVGTGSLVFTDYVLHLYMGGTLAEVFGIVFVITRYLFSPKRDN